MIKGIQIVGIVVCIYLIAQTLLNHKRGNYGIRRMILWTGLWMLTVTLFAYPRLAQLTLPILTTQDAMISVLVIGLTVAFFLIYQTYQLTSKIERRLTRIVQNLAIRDYLKESSSQKGEDDKA